MLLEDQPPETTKMAARTKSKVTLKYNTCLGSCAQGPVIAIDHHLIGKQTPESAAKIARDLRGLDD